jgi:hypothetical protein
MPTAWAASQSLISTGLLIPVIVANFLYILKGGLRPPRRAAARATPGRDPAARHAPGPRLASLGTPGASVCHPAGRVGASPRR